MAAYLASRYVQLLADDVLRGIKALSWFIGVPHTASEDGFYEGFFILRGELFFCANLQLIVVLPMSGARVIGHTWL